MSCHAEHLDAGHKAILVSGKKTKLWAKAEENLLSDHRNKETQHSSSHQLYEQQQ